MKTQNQIILQLIVLITCFISANAQIQDNIWLFGTSSVDTFVLDYQWGNTTVDFSNIEPRFYYNQEISMDFSGANASICDEEGNLILYSNGMQIMGPENVPILHGDTIAYSNYWENWVQKDWFPDGSDWVTGFPLIQDIVLLPISNKRFFALYKKRRIDGENVLTESLIYSDIKKNQDGQYEVIAKDKLIMEDIFDVAQMNACRHANGRDWWLIQQNIEGDSLFVFIIDYQGVKLHQKVHSNIILKESNSLSQVAFNSKGDKYAQAIRIDIEEKNSQVITHYNFDRCLGELTSNISDTIDNFATFPVLAFSPSGRYLYASTYETLYQYDLTEEDWVSSRLPIAEYDGFFFQYTESTGKQETKLGPLTLAPDGRIYSVPPGNQRYLHTIEYPNERGEEANVIQHKIKIPTSNFRSIPNFPFYRLGPEDGSPCDTLGLDNQCIAQFRYAQDTMDHLKVRFTDISYFRPENWTWDFGDGTTYEGKKPYFHTFPEDGVYHVCLTVSNENGQDKYCKDLFLGVTSTERPKLDHSQVNLFPNPVDDQLYIELRDYLPRNANFRVYNNIGQIILQEKIYVGWNHYDVKSLPNGIYHYSIFDQGLLYSSTFVK